MRENLKQMTEHYPNTLSILQQRRNAWVAHNFPERGEGNFNGLVVGLMGATEELGELAHHILKRDQGIRKEDHDAQIKDAVGDIIIYLMGIATHEGFDIGEVLVETWEQVEKRDWIKFPGNGVDK